MLPCALYCMFGTVVWLHACVHLMFPCGGWYNPVSPTVWQYGGVIVSSSSHISVGGREGVVQRCTCAGDSTINQVYGADEGELPYSFDLGRWCFIRPLTAGCVCVLALWWLHHVCHAIPDNSPVSAFAPGFLSCVLEKYSKHNNLNYIWSCEICSNSRKK